MKVMILDHPRPFVEAHFNDVANAPLSASLNTGYAAAIAESAGCDVHYVDFYQTDASGDDMAEAVLKEAPDVLLVHWVYTWDDCSTVKTLIASVKNSAPDVRVFAFGLFPTLCSHDLLRDTPGLDEILTGGFEIALHERLTQLQGHRRQLRQLLIPKDLGRTATLSHLNVAASRGCYGNCSFCFIPPYYGRSAWHGRVPAEVFEEIDVRRQSRPVDRVYFVDPNFFGPGKTSQERAMRIATGLAERGLTFGLEARVNDVHDETIGHMKTCGLESMFLGIESASPSVLRRMRKGIAPEQSSRAIRILQRYDVLINVGFLMFEADSTMADLRTNYDFLESHGLLSDPATTANVLYHNQIIIKGSPAYTALGKANRLIKNPETPYEAEAVYADSAVAFVQEGMAECSRHYLREACAGGDLDQAAWNERLKARFLDLCEQADGKRSKQALYQR